MAKIIFECRGDDNNCLDCQFLIKHEQGSEACFLFKIYLDKNKEGLTERCPECLSAEEDQQLLLRCCECGAELPSTACPECVIGCLYPKVKEEQRNE